MKKFISILLILVVSLAVAAPSQASTSKLYNGKARWKRLKGAKYYNLYYKETGEKKFTNAVNHLSRETDDFSVKHLIIGKTYEYRISAMDKFNQEVWITSLDTLKRIY